MKARSPFIRLRTTNGKTIHVARDYPWLADIQMAIKQKSCFEFGGCLISKGDQSVLKFKV